jgi:hypothetical protein
MTCAQWQRVIDGNLFLCTWSRNLGRLLSHSKTWKAYRPPNFCDQGRAGVFLIGEYSKSTRLFRMSGAESKHLFSGPRYNKSEFLPCAQYWSCQPDRALPSYMKDASAIMDRLLHHARSSPSMAVATGSDPEPNNLKSAPPPADQAQIRHKRRLPTGYPFIPF